MNGHAVRVVTKQVGGGQVENFYYVAEPDPVAAQVVMRNALGLDDQDVTAVAPLSDKVVSALGLKAGAWMKWR
ncbi:MULTISPECIES: hypothetical protein [unclassified Ruegeria]|uniref:hypothetical protein n=1 Tax=unclassified Ruegeria TaxID=2625375 RepID=UPI001487E9F9|nr:MULTISPECIES: hypothetical protein [unclassified Ruegeria]